MKAMRQILLTCLLVASLSTQASVRELCFHHFNGLVASTMLTAVDSLTYNETLDTLLVIRGGQRHAIALEGLQSLSVRARSDEPTVDITYDGNNVSVDNPYAFEGVEVNIDGAHVSITDRATEEVEFRLSGSSDNGSLTLRGDIRYQLTLCGLTLTNPTGPAINSQCKKKGTIKSLRGTVNTLCDGASYAESDEDQKGTLFSEGQLVFKGAGTLNVSSLYKHAICSDDYVRIENSSIYVTAAVSDAIHANDSICWRGGHLTLTASGDGMDSEGPVVLAAPDSCQLEVTLSGTAAKGVKSKGNIDVLSGTMTFTMSGAMETGSDASYSTALKAGGDITVGGGSLTIVNSGAGGKGLSADGSVNVTDGTLNIRAAGKGGTYTPQNDDEEDADPDAPSYIVYVSIPTTTSGGGSGGGQAYWTNVYLYDSSNTRVATLTKTCTIKATTGTTKTFYYYDFGGPAEGTYHFRSDNYTSMGGGPGGGGGGGGTTYTVMSKTFAGPTDGSDIYLVLASSYTTSGTTRTFSYSNATNSYSKGTKTYGTSVIAYTGACIKADKDVNISGGTFTLLCSGTGAKGIKADGNITISGGDVGITASAAGATYKSNNQTDSYASRGLTADGNIRIAGGTTTIKMTGKGGKGIKADGTLTIGTEDGGCPTLSVATTGAAISTTGNGMEQGFIGSTKAIKVMGAAIIYDGDITITTAANGAEGLESKTSVTLNGGDLYFKCYDDCINSSGNIVNNGANVFCWSTGNDAIDSNSSQTGAITLAGGITFAFTTKGSPEEGLDCDNNSRIRVTGGYALSAGASQGGSSSNTLSGATQGYAFLTTSVSYTAARYYTLSDGDGNVVMTWKFPTSVSSSLSLFTAPTMVKGTTYYIKYSTTKPETYTTEFNGFWIGNPTAGTTSVKSFTAK